MGNHGPVGEYRDLEQRAADGRDETEAERIDRNLIELLQELRVASIGVQVLFGFLLSLPFTTRFSGLDDAQTTLYVADLTLAALATALLTAPVAHHRLEFRRHEKARMLHRANRMAIAGLAALAVAISGSVLLVLTVVAHGVVVAIIAAAVTAVIVTLWFVVPFVGRDRPDDY
jgi:putative flippase GtrA